MQDGRLEHTWDAAEERRRLKAAQKDLDEFDWFYEQYGPAIWRFLRRLVRDSDVADDLTAETFSKGFQALQGYEWRGVRYSAYLYRVAAHEATSYWRRRVRRPSVELDQVSLASPLRDALSSVALTEQLALMLAEIEKLDETDRRVLEMYHLQERSIAEIALELQKPVGTIKARLSRAREKLSLRLAETNRERLPARMKSRKWLDWLMRQRKLGREAG